MSLLELMTLTTILFQIAIIVCGYRILKIATYVIAWEKSWVFFIISAGATLLRRLCELFNIDSFIHSSLAIVSSVFTLLFIYNISKVFININILNNGDSKELE